MPEMVKILTVVQTTLFNLLGGSSKLYKMLFLTEFHGCFHKKNSREFPNPVWLYTERSGKSMIKHFVQLLITHTAVQKETVPVNFAETINLSYSEDFKT